LNNAQISAVSECGVSVVNPVNHLHTMSDVTSLNEEIPLNDFYYRILIAEISTHQYKELGKRYKA
jgi:hypothetical protein